MIPIVLVGEGKCSAGTAIYNCLSEKYPAAYLSAESIMLSDGGAKYIIYDGMCIPKLPETPGIIIFKPRLKCTAKITIPQDYTVIVGSDNHNALHALKCVNRRIITCGMSPRDTLSISSCAGNTASVSLQRQVIRLDGEAAQECEITINNEAKMSEYSILTTAAVRLLCSV